MNLDGKKALVTGATGGLGQAIARALARKGARVVVTGRRTDVLAPLAKEIGAETIACDLADRSALIDLIARSKDVDVLIANAGIPGSGTYATLADDDVDHIIDVNLRAPILMSHALGKEMAARGSGHIVLVSSLSGIVASPANSMYNATKFGLRGFAHSLRQDIAPAGVGVSVVLPGFIRDAGMFADSGVELPRAARTKSPEDVADSVVRCVEENRGEVLVAPFELRLGSKFGSLFPSIAARAQNLPAARKSWGDLAEAQHGKR